MTHTQQTDTREVLASMFPIEIPPAMDSEALEYSRKMTAELVVSCANEAKNLRDLLAKLREQFGSEFTKLGNGVSRVGYTLPYGLVLKYCYARISGVDQNKVELAVYEEKWMPKIYASYRSKDWKPYIGWGDGRAIDQASGINIIVSERVTVDPYKYERCSWAAEGEANYDERFAYICEHFRDTHRNNLGIRANGEWVLLDAGLGRARYDDGERCSKHMSYFATRMPEDLEDIEAASQIETFHRDFNTDGERWCSMCKRYEPLAL